MVLIVTSGATSKFARPTLGPFTIVDIHNQNFNGMVTVRRSPNVMETINIRRLRLYRTVDDANTVPPVLPSE